MKEARIKYICSALFSLLVISLTTGCSFHYHEPSEYSQDAAENDGIDWVRWFDLTAQWAMAIGAFLLFWLTRKTLIHAEETADNSMKLTRESIKVQIDGNRAVLGLVDFRVDRHTGVFAFALKNIGQSPATIIGLEIRPNTSIQHLLIQKPFIQVDMFYPLMTGEAYVWDENRRDTVLHPISGIPGQLWMDQEDRTKWKPGILAVTLFYRTLGGEYINQTAIEIYPSLTVKVIADDRVTYDGPVPDDIATHNEQVRKIRLRRQ